MTADVLPGVPLTAAQEILAASFRRTHDAREFDEFKGDMVFYENAPERFYYPPYVPFVGDRYDRYRILLYATAQNLANTVQVRGRYFQMGDEAMYRLCRLDRPAPWGLDIAPVMSGVLPALAGVYVYAVHGERLASLEDVAAHLATTNLYKYSLWEQPLKEPVNSTPQKDLNPDRYPKGKRYGAATFAAFVQPEMTQLRPRTVLCLRGPCLSLLKGSSAGVRILEVNDPSWILQGGGGCLSPTGSWGRDAQRLNDPVLDDLVAGYCKQIVEKGGTRYGVKQEAVGIYLRYYHRRFKHCSS